MASRKDMAAPKIALAVLLVAAFMDLLDVSIVAVALPAIRADLGASEAALQWTVAAYTLAFAAGLITGGRLGDVIGRRRVFLAGVGAFVACSVACALAWSPGALIATRALQGLAAAMMVPQVLAIITAAFPAGQRAAALGAYGATLGTAAVAGPILGGLLVDLDALGTGWRAIFLVNVPVGLAALALGARVLPESRTARRSQLDLVGVVLGAGALTLLLFPLVRGRELGWPAWTFALIGCSAVVAALFVTWERRMERRGGTPLMPLSLFDNRAYVSGALVSFAFFSTISAFFLVFVLYLQLGVGRDALAAGLACVPFSVGSALTSGASVALAPRLGRIVLVVGASLMAVGMTWLALAVAAAGVEPSWLALALPLALSGAGMGLVAPPLIDVCLAAVAPERAGVASGVLSTATQAGSATGVAAIGAIFFGALPVGRPAGEALADALTTTLPWVAAILAASALLMTLLPGTARPEHEIEPEPLLAGTS
jgi:EmrB/QacA subfamily drug resistance transporter